MAKYGQKVITVNVDCNTTQAEEKVRNLAQSVKRVERDGRINLEAVINTSSLKKLDTLVGNKEVNIDFKAKNLSELEKAYEKFNKFPNISGSVLKQLDFAKADIKDKAINKIQQEYQHINEKTTEDIYNKLSKKLYNPQYNERSDLSDAYKNEVKALVDMYASAQGDFDKTFQTRNGKKTFRQFFNSVKKDFKLRDDTIYKQMMEDFNNDYGKKSAELLKLSSSFKNMSYKDLEKFLQLPKYDYNSIKKFYDSAMAGTLDEHLKVEPEIETATIKSQVENAVADVKANINVDSDSVQAVKSELADIDTHLNTEDDIQRTKDELSNVDVKLKTDESIKDIKEHNTTTAENDIKVLQQQAKNRIVEGEYYPDVVKQEIYSKLQKAWLNPEKIGGKYTDDYKNKLKALAEIYNGITSDWGEKFTDKNGKNVKFGTMYKKIADYQTESDNFYNQLMSEYKNGIQKYSENWVSLGADIFNDKLNKDQLLDFMKLPDLSGETVNKFYEKLQAARNEAQKISNAENMKSNSEIKPKINAEEIKSEIQNSVSNIDAHLNVDDDINKVKESLSEIPTHLDIDDDIDNAKIEASSVTTQGVTTGGKNKLDKQKELLEDQNVNLKINVNPPIESIKSQIEALPDKTVKIKINTGKSLENLKKLTQGLQDYDLNETLKMLKSISQSFNYAFKNVNQAAKAPMDIIRNMNKEVVGLKKNLSEIGIEKATKTNSQKFEDNLKTSFDRLQKQNAKLEQQNAQLKQNAQKEKQIKKDSKPKEWSPADAKKLNTAKEFIQDYDDSSENIISDVKARLDVKRKEAEKLLKKFVDLDSKKNKKTLGDEVTKGELTELSQLVEYANALNEAKKAKNKIRNENGTLIDSKAKFENGYGNASNVEKINAVTKALEKQGIVLTKIDKVNSKKEMYDYKYREGTKEITGRAYLEMPMKGSDTEASIRTSVKKIETYQTAGEKWLSGFKAKFKNLAQYIAGAEIQNQILAQVKQGISFVKEYDSALTNIGMTMQATQGQLQNLGKEAISTGQELGTSATDVIDAAKIYANANETTESVLQKSQATIKLKNASGQDISTVADQVQGVINQFDGMEDQETRIVNSLEKISAGLGIDFAKGISIMSDATKTAGSVANEAGLSFEKYAASVGKISEMTRLEGSTIGNAYKTIMARISRSKSADSDVSDADRSNAAKALASVNISTYDNKGNFKDLEEILDELSGKWKNLSDAQRNYMNVILF